MSFRISTISYYIARSPVSSLPGSTERTPFIKVASELWPPIYESNPLLHCLRGKWILLLEDTVYSIRTPRYKVERMEPRTEVVGLVEGT